jgi:hypothetical protein
MNRRSSNIQAPSSRETLNFKLQSADALLLEFDYWSFSGAWVLELGAFGR